MPKTTKLSEISDIAFLSKKLLPISKLNIDILTIAIGPEHHDIRLLDIQVLFDYFFSLTFNKL